MELVGLIRGAKTDRVLADRARMVLWWDDGMSAAEISDRLGVTPRTAASWRSRYAVEGAAGLADRPKALKRRGHDGQVRSRLVALTRMSPPAELGLSHWSSRALARYFTCTEE